MSIALMAICCLIIPGVMAASTAPMITYTATGTFAAPANSGTDTLKLAGEPFSVAITVSASTVPYKTGPNWAAYHQLRLTGQVHSGLLGPTPVSIASGEASIQQALAYGQFDQFIMQAPIKVVGIDLTIKAVIYMPWGTISNQLLHPFSAITLAPGNATLSYSDGVDTTVLAIASGTLQATIPTGATVKPTFRATHLTVSGVSALFSRRYTFVG